MKHTIFENRSVVVLETAIEHTSTIRTFCMKWGEKNNHTFSKIKKKLHIQQKAEDTKELSCYRKENDNSNNSYL